MKAVQRSPSAVTHAHRRPSQRRATSTHRPWVDVVVDEVHVAKLDLEVHLELLVKGVVAVVRHGRLVNLRFLRCDVAASLSVEGIEVARKDGALDPSLVADFGDGIPLTPDPATTPPERGGRRGRAPREERVRAAVDRRTDHGGAARPPPRAREGEDRPAAARAGHRRAARVHERFGGDPRRAARGLHPKESRRWRDCHRRPWPQLSISISSTIPSSTCGLPLAGSGTKHTSPYLPGARVPRSR